MNDFEKAQYEYDNQELQEQKALFKCSKCLEDIYSGDEYYSINNENYCCDCEYLALSYFLKIAGDE